ncbi:tetratricopeptide repeat protein [Aggregatimonas sangjinii]|uniref:Tetratricopeptide repeat protein n=1 Tax=Aggregatimonas sangjinii TaxID=2583587 RepID=A0A5B7SZ41_9FLAO|nr:tetratricopeptide repeat protein [Aggregatimonas sangjinii]QCX02064.1 tetratricopeptide repeat protein [Aggregatimonas sangjinii]
MKRFVLFIFLAGSFASAQEDDAVKAQEKALRESKNLTYEGNQELTTNKFIEAEVEYRKAIAKSDQNAVAPYNLGNAYYNNATYSEAFGRFKQAGERASEKPEKHKAYHNMGNVFMKRKEYEKAVEAYKQALRNNPKDEETRYNLALAKEMLKKDQQNQDQNKDDKNEDEKDKKDDKKDGDNKEENKDQQDKGDEGDQKKENEEENKEGDGDKKEEQKNKPKEGDEKEEQQRRPNQLSKQQIQNLLEAMQQEEKKVQQKIDAKKVKGVKVKNEKDW